MPRGGPVITDPTHIACDAPVRWSRGNLSEFLPGVVTPFTWDFWLTNEAASQRIYYRLGLASRAELGVPTRPEHRMTGIFHGWPVANVDALRNMIDRAPGDAGDSFERQLLGESDLPGQIDPPARRKHPLRIALRSGLWFLTFPREIRAQLAQTEAWWQAFIPRVERSSLDACGALLDEAVRRNESVSVQAGFGLFGGQMLFGRLEALLPPSHRHLILSLISGHGQLREVRLVEEMWRIAKTGEDPQGFIDRYGYYGLAVGECANPSWREDPAAVRETIEAYKQEPDAAAPAARQYVRTQAVTASLAALDAVLSPARRRTVRKLIGRLEQFTLWREDGKACTLMATDGARAVVRRMGVLLADAGVLDDANDAFFFTRAELQRAPWDGMRQTAVWRKARRAFNEKRTIPDAFVGAPIVQQTRSQTVPKSSSTGGHVDGVGVSPGIVEGIARVVMDPRKVPAFRTGDILICVVTDPSWAPLFTRAGGIVTDVGGLLSHGAVIARELGVPCVVNTRGGTERIRDGARIRIDGTTGIVRILTEPVEANRHAV